MILKTSNKSACSNAFWSVKVHIFWKFVQYTTHWHKTQMLKKFLPYKKHTLFFLSWAPTHHSFTFDWQFVYELKHKAHLSKTVWDFQFLIWSRFYQSLYFYSTKSMVSMTLKRHNSFQQSWAYKNNCPWQCDNRRSASQEVCCLSLKLLMHQDLVLCFHTPAESNPYQRMGKIR